MDLTVFYEVLVPLLEMGKSTLLMISTPVDSHNFFSALMNLKDPDTGAPVFLVFDVDLICKRCKKKKIQTDCTHMLSFLPPWKSVEKQKSVKLIMKDQQEILQRESFGSVTDSGTPLIAKFLVERFKSKVPWRLSMPGTSVPWVMVAFDPNAGGSAKSSECALVAMFIYQGVRVVSLKFICGDGCGTILSSGGARGELASNPRPGAAPARRTLQCNRRAAASRARTT